MKAKFAAPVTKAEFDAFFARLSNAGRWGPDDAKGTLNYLTADCVRAAAALVQTGRSVSMAVPINTTAGPDNPHPPAHYMATTYDIRFAFGQPQFATDFFGSEIHGDCHTHFDALCHVGYNGKLYNDKPTSAVTSHGPTILDITAFAHGIVGRGVLIDLPRLYGEPWLQLGHAVTADEILAAEAAQDIRLRSGDIMAFRTGHHARRLARGAWNPGPLDEGGEGRAGLHVTALELLHEREVAVFLPDGDGETIPSNVQGVCYPIHAIQLPAMGMVCADSLQFEELVLICEELRRWEFMVTFAPLRLPKGTGSLFNPIAIF